MSALDAAALLRYHDAVCETKHFVHERGRGAWSLPQRRDGPYRLFLRAFRRLRLVVSLCAGAMLPAGFECFAAEGFRILPVID